ncbi:hypothetical protein QQ045_033059 [Rhodiola kirilowii]
MELRNQCRIIRTTELAAVQEKLSELERQKEDTLKAYSPSSFLQKLQEVNDKTEEESEALHRQLLDREIDLPTFVQKIQEVACHISPTFSDTYCCQDFSRCTMIPYPPLNQSLVWRCGDINAIQTVQLMLYMHKC